MTDGSEHGRRRGANTTFSSPAYQDDDGLDPVMPQDLLDPEATGAGPAPDEMDGFHQPTAMFDKGRFLGELAELVDEAPPTRHKVEAEVAPPKGCRIIVVAGIDLGMEWSFKTPEIYFGRDEDCEILMPDIGVSRRHARISLEGGHFYLQDLNSGNGTFLNGVKISREVLVAGDEIVIGERTFRFVELNEAPATAAAHPVPKNLPKEPSVGSVAPIDDGAFEPLGRASQVNVEVPPEPSVRASVEPPSPPGPKPGAALRLVAGVVGGMVFLGAMGVGAYFGYQRYFVGETPEQKTRRSKIEFMQGVALAKHQRCEDALVMFERVLMVRPDYARAQEYRTFCQQELERAGAIRTAKQMVQAARFVEALALLDAVPPESRYHDDAQNLRDVYRRAYAKSLVDEARRRLSSGEDTVALSLLDQALERMPGFADAMALRAEIEALERPESGPRPPPKPTIPPQLVRAVALYKNGQIAAAMDAAEAAGGAEAREYIARMERVKALLNEAGQAHKQKAASELLRIAPAALELDGQIADGDGKVREKLVAFYADGLYLKGIEALQDGDDTKAFKMLTDALKAQPGHKLAETRLAELSSKARDIYYEGYVLKDSNPTEARKIFKRLVQTTRPDNQYHKLAKKWLGQNGG